MKKVLLILGILSLLIVLGASAYFGIQYFKTKSELDNLKKLSSQDSTKLETALLIEKVSKHMILSTDETPTIATITDKNKLTSQPFFDKAKNGDKVLIYLKEKRAILYDPAADRIVEVSPIAMPSPTVEAPLPPTSYPTRIPTPTISLKVSLRSSASTPSAAPTSKFIVPR